ATASCYTCTLCPRSSIRSSARLWIFHRRAASVRLLFFFSSRRRHTRSVSAFLLNRSSDLVLFLVLWLKLVKDFLKVRCRLALLPFLISCLIWLDLVASLPLIKERILVIILLLHFLSLMLGSVL